MGSINKSRIIKFFGGFIAGGLLLNALQWNEVMAARTVEVTYNNMALELSNEPKMVEQRIMLPLRDISRQLGYEVNWEKATGKIEVVDGSYKVILQLGSKSAVVNGEAITIETAPQSIHGVTYVPLRFVGEAMELGVQWNDKESKVNLEGKYTVDKKAKKLMVRTQNGKKAVGDVETYEGLCVDWEGVSLMRTKVGSEIVSADYLIQGALTNTAATIFYIKDGKVIDRFIEEPSVLPKAGILLKENQVAISTGTEFKIYDDLTGMLIKSYNLKEKLGGEGFAPISYGENYIVGRYENTIHVIDLVSGKVTRILDFIPESTEEEKEAKYYVYMDDMKLTAQDNIKLVWETDKALVFKYYDAVEKQDKTITYSIGK